MRSTKGLALTFASKKADNKNPSATLTVLYVVLQMWSSLTANVHHSLMERPLAAASIADHTLLLTGTCSMCAYLHAVQLHATEPSQTCFTPTPLLETCDV